MILNLKDVIKMYGPKRAVNGVTLAADKGDVIAVCGSTGSGKTTLANMICGIEKPDAGEIVVCGTHMETLSEEKRSRLRSEYMGVLSGQAELLSELSLLENAALARAAYGEPRHIRMKKARALMTAAGLRNGMHTKPGGATAYQLAATKLVTAAMKQPRLLMAERAHPGLTTSEIEKLWGIWEKLFPLRECAVVLFTTDTLAKHAARIFTMCDGKLMEE